MTNENGKLQEQLRHLHEQLNNFSRAAICDNWGCRKGKYDIWGAKTDLNFAINYIMEIASDGGDPRRRTCYSKCTAWQTWYIDIDSNSDRRDTIHTLKIYSSEPFPRIVQIYEWMSLLALRESNNDQREMEGTRRSTRGGEH